MLKVAMLLGIAFGILFAGFSVHAAPTKKTCGNRSDISYCYYPGAATSQRLVYFFHGYGDNVNSWNSNYATHEIEKEWKKTNILRPHVIVISRGAWWYTEKSLGVKLDSFVTWFESTKLNFVPDRVLYGESMGGHNAYRWSLDSPQLFNRLALTCPAFPKFFVKDAPVGSGSGMFEYFAEQMIGNAYASSSQPEFNPLLHSVNEMTASSIVKTHVVVSDIDGFGFYDGGMAVHRLLSRESGMQVSLEVQRVSHCKHDAAALAKFLAEP